MSLMALPRLCGFWLCWVFVAAWGAGGVLSLVAASRGHSVWSAGFSHCRPQALGARASVVVARGLSGCGSWALELGLCSCGTCVHACKVASVVSNSLRPHGL